MTDRTRGRIVAAMAPPIFLDGHSTTRVDPRVREAMAPFEGDLCGNPSSPHRAGSRSAQALATARAQAASLAGAEPASVTFTASATEANNLAIWGFLGALGPRPGGRVAVSAMEHKSVSEPARAAARAFGLEFVVVPVDAWGRVNEDALREAVQGAVLVCCQLANNEVGTVQDIGRVAALTHTAGAVLHVDATQGIGRVPFSMRSSGADLVTFASHKIHGPKGAGALVARAGVPLRAMMQGGQQEHGLRPGTENVPAIVGFGAACALYEREGTREAARLAALRNELAGRLAHAIPDGVGILGPYAPTAIGAGGHWPSRLGHNLSVWIAGVRGRALVEALADRVCCSTGAACNCRDARSTDVLRAMGVSDARGEEVVRFGLGRFTTADEVARAAQIVADAAQSLRGRGR